MNLINDTSWPPDKRAAGNAARTAAQARKAVPETARSDESAKTVSAAKGAQSSNEEPLLRDGKRLAGDRIEVWDSDVTAEDLHNLCRRVPGPIRGPNLAAECKAVQAARDAVSGANENLNRVRDRR
jgi:hypothetical protein